MWGLAFGLLLVFSAFVFSGMLTDMPDQKLEITPQTVVALQALKPRLRFESDQYYTGIIDPVERARAAADFSNLIDTLAKELPQHPYTSVVEKEMLRAFKPFRLADTEDRERAIIYCEEVFGAVGARDTGRFLNILLYGPILGRLVGR
jgi:hypothetical protein